MFLTKRHCIIVLLVFLVLLAACRYFRQTDQRKLLVYTPHGQDMLRDFVARYKQAHPEADVQFLDMGSREVFGTRKISRG